MSGQHRRCLGLLRAGISPLTEADVRFRYLAARCLAALNEWEEVLALLSTPGAGPDFEDLPPAVRAILLLPDIRKVSMTFGCRQRVGGGAGAAEQPGPAPTLRTSRPR